MNGWQVEQQCKLVCSERCVCPPCVVFGLDACHHEYPWRKERILEETGRARGAGRRGAVLLFMTCAALVLCGCSTPDGKSRPVHASSASAVGGWGGAAGARVQMRSARAEALTCADDGGDAKQSEVQQAKAAPQALLRKSVGAHRVGGMIRRVRSLAHPGAEDRGGRARAKPACSRRLDAARTPPARSPARRRLPSPASHLALRLLLLLGGVKGVAVRHVGSQEATQQRATAGRARGRFSHLR